MTFVSYGRLWRACRHRWRIRRSARPQPAAPSFKALRAAQGPVPVRTIRVPCQTGHPPSRVARRKVEGGVRDAGGALHTVPRSRDFGSRADVAARNHSGVCSPSEQCPAHIVYFGQMPKASSSHERHCPVSPAPIGHFRDQQSGTYFGKTTPSLPSSGPLPSAVSLAVRFRECPLTPNSGRSNLRSQASSRRCWGADPALYELASVTELVHVSLQRSLKGAGSIPCRWQLSPQSRTFASPWLPS